jgi:hypothetical protein
LATSAILPGNVTWFRDVDVNSAMNARWQAMARIVLHDWEAKPREMLMRTDNMRQRIVTKLAFLLLGAGLMLVGQPAGAISIYSETFTTPNTGTQSDNSIAILFNDFMPVTDGVITDVTWLGMYNSGPDVYPTTDTFTISFYQNNAGNVGAQMASILVGNSVNRTDTGTNFGTSPFFSYAASLGAGVSVTAGLSYWVSIVNDTSPDWWWASYNVGEDYNGPGDAPWSYDCRFNNKCVWAAGTDYAYYFALSGVAPTVPPVPLPPTLALMLPGLALLGFVARRRKVV